MSRSIVRLTVLALLLTTAAVTAQQSDPMTGLSITEVSWKSVHPSADAVTSVGGKANGDWYELTNQGTAAINLGGYLMDDDDQLFGNDFAVLPSFSIQPNETIIVVQENDANVTDGFRSAWGLPADLRILSECTSTGGDPFSGISSGGDELNIYPPHAVDAAGLPALDPFGELIPPILSIAVPATGSNSGQSYSWDAAGNFLGFSVDSGTPISGAYPALHDGSETDPPYAMLDVASPGYVEGLDTAPTAGTQPTLTRLFPNEPHLTCPTQVSCDADGDGDCDLDDLDALYAANGSAGPELDMDSSGTVDANDIDDWLSAASSADNPAKPDPADVFKFGDIDLNGDVNSTDLGRLLNNFGNTSGGGWGAGDLNLDDNINSTDLGLLLNEFGHTSAAASVAAVPEPALNMMLAIAMLAVTGFVRRRRH